MLKIIKNLDDIDFRQLMNVYEQTNCQTGRLEYPKLSENLQIIYAEQDFYAFLETFFRTQNAMYCVWQVGGIYSSVLRLEPYQDGMLIEAVETALAERQKGYAFALLKSVIAYLSMNGKGKLYAHIEKENVASLRLHQKCGFTIVADDAVYIDGIHHLDSYTLCLEY